MNAKALYRQYCEEHDVPLFFRPSWLDLYNHDWQVVLESELSVTLFFVYFPENKFGFSFIRNPILTPYSGFLFSSSEIDELTRNRLYERILKLIPDVSVFYIDLLPEAGIRNIQSRFSCIDKRTNLLDIQDMSQCLVNFKPALQRQIRKAKKILQIIHSDDMERFYRLHSLTFQKQNLQPPYRIANFIKLWDYCKINQCGQLLFAENENGETHAAMFLVYDEQTAYYLAGGTDEQYYGSGAMSYLMSYAIQFAADEGCKQFDFEGSMIPGINKFFQNFNPIETHYISLQKMSPMYKIYRKLFH
ncbi:MAG: GNAT family N-acetyltransferase [Chitinophagaceae bacterium]|nr:GNAT family N-acetyltransferase [Chitinophagaceae bacterium]